MNVLVTGATGFLGAAVCRQLRRAGHRVLATGRDPVKGRRLAADGFAFRPAALDQAEGGAAAAGLCAGQEAVVHCAALSAPWGRWADFWSANVVATGRLLRAARQGGVRRFVHLSTPSLYFDYRHRCGLTERSPLAARPANAYVATKRLAERMVLGFGSAAGEPSVVVLRPRALFGPGDQTLLPRLWRAAARGRLPVIGDGRNWADLTYVDNAALAVARAVEAPDAAAGEVYNVTNGEPVRLWEFLGTLWRRLGAPGPRRRVPVAAALAAAAGAEGVGFLTGREPVVTRYGVGVLAYSQTFDLRRARDVLGYVPAVSLEEGLRRLAAALAAAGSGGAPPADGPASAWDPHRSDPDETGPGRPTSRARPGLPGSSA